MCGGSMAAAPTETLFTLSARASARNRNLALVICGSQFRARQRVALCTGALASPWEDKPPRLALAWDEPNRAACLPLARPSRPVWLVMGRQAALVGSSQA